MQRLMRQASMLLLVALAATAMVTVGAAATAGAAPGDLPVGTLETAQPLPGAVRLTGWALDGNSDAPVDLHFYADGQFLGYGRADDHHPEVAATYPWAGPNRGFSETFPLGPGRHTICAFAINIGLGDQNPQLGCLVVANDVPFGWLDVAAREPGGIRLRGWSIDPAAPSAPSAVYVEVGWGFTGMVAADQPNAAVAAAYPGAGPDHGFDVLLPSPALDGPVPVCVYAARGTSPIAIIGCVELQVRSNPFGSLDAVRSGSGSVRVTGWALDQDTAGAIEVHVYTEDGLARLAVANGHRPDVAAAHPGFGDAHGFVLDLPAHYAGQQVCAYAINVGNGGNVALGCQRSGPLVPAGSGEGRRIVYHNVGQYLWLVGADGFADRSYLVSGRYLDPGPGVYYVYGFLRYASSVTDGVTMEYFVAFHPAGVGYGFHTIPVDASGTPLQSEAELGSFRSAGCVRQAWGDAVYLWNWADVGTPVVVV